MMATRLQHKEVEAMYNKLSQDRRSRPWKRGEPDPESSQTDVNSAAPKATGPAAGSAQPPEDQPARVPPRGTQKNTPASADSENPTNPKKNPPKSQPVQIFET